MEDLRSTPVVLGLTPFADALKEHADVHGQESDPQFPESHVSGYY